MTTIIMSNGYGAVISYIPRISISVMRVDKHGNCKPCYNQLVGCKPHYSDVAPDSLYPILRKIRKLKPRGISSDDYRGEEKRRDYAQKIN